MVRLPPVMEKLQPTLATRSDVIRIHLLRKYGGVWADATLWCARSLDDWIDSVVTEPSCFFAYEKPGPPCRPISSWFLAAGEDSRIIDLWQSAVRHLLKKTYAHVRYRKMMGGKENGASFNNLLNLYAYYLSKRYRYGELLIPISRNYSWVHYLFHKLLKQNEEFRGLWDSTPKLSADGPHFLHHEGFLSTPTARTAAVVRNRDANVIKLTHKVSFPEDVSGTLLGVLYDTVEQSIEVDGATSIPATAAAY